MNFTRNTTVNQKIDRITDKHIIVGIDIAKNTHVAQAVDFRGRQLTNRALSFNNEGKGLEKLQEWIQQVLAKHHLYSVVVGLEPTGHYWFNVAHWLLEREIPIVLVNPVMTHRYKENRDNSPSKNDAKDALSIAALVSQGTYSDYIPSAEEYDRLQTLMSHREYAVKQLTSVGNRIVRWIDLYFPEFRHVFKEWDGLRAIASLQAFPLPSDVRTLTVEEVVQGWRAQGMRRAGGASGIRIAVALKEVARTSIGYNRAEKEARQEIAHLLELYAQLAAQVATLQLQTEQLLGDIPIARLLRSIPGMGTIVTAAILAGTGDLRDYAHGRQVLRRAGLNLAECTSGLFKGQIKLSKRGDSMLRKYLFLAVVGLVGHNPEFARMHQENQRRGKKKMESLFKLIGKLCRIMVGMATSGEMYRSEALQAA